MTKERPILFNTEMVQAILAGRKTQTRRVIKPQPDEVARESIPDWNGDLHQIKVEDPDGNRLFGFCTSPDLAEGDYYGAMKSPYGQPGDLLYVRETWAEVMNADEELFFAYKADFSWSVDRWRPSIHMPKAAARIWLKVTNVRVERVQDISEEDAIAEGINMDSDYASLCINIEDAGYSNDLPKGSAALAVFKRLWDSINAKRGYSWHRNPWVWVVEFEVLSTVGKPQKPPRKG